MLTVPAAYISTRHHTASVTQAARKPPQKQQTRRGKPPEVPRATQGGHIVTVLGSNGGKAFPNLTKMSTTMASESSGRIPELKTTTAVSSSTSGTGPTGSQTSSLLVSQHPLLCSLLSSPSPQQLVVTPRRQQSQEVGVGGGWRNPE